MYRFYFFLFICFNLLSVDLFSKCGEGVIVLPVSGIVAPNTMFMLEYYGVFENNQHDPEKSHRLYDLTSPDSIGFGREIFVCGEELTCLYFLKPLRALTPGHQYKMEVKHRDKNGYFRLDEKIWTADKENDTDVPLLIAEPQFIGFSYLRMNCGDAQYAHFCICTQKKADVFVHVKMKKAGESAEKEFYFNRDSAIVDIGNGMCFGGFVFEKSAEYDMRFQLMDICGNTDGKWTEYYRVKCPPPETYVERSRLSCNCVREENQAKNYSSLIILSLSSVLVILISLYILKMQFGGNQR